MAQQQAPIQPVIGALDEALAIGQQADAENNNAAPLPARRVPAPRPVAGAWPGQAGATGRGISRTFPFILPTPASPGHLQVYL